MDNKKKVLFICTYNSARSQMAEGLFRALYGDHYKSYSAGTKSSQVNPYAIKVMAEIGIDISTHRSKNIEEFQGIKFDCVVTVCDHAKGNCPFLPGAGKYIHKFFEDPGGKTEGEIVSSFRRVRDEIKEWIQQEFKND